MKPNRPLVFACSGCSDAGQLANQVALELDRRGIAEMSCLAGVGAGKPHFLKKLRGREVWVIDGCQIDCGLGIFNLLGEVIDVHIRLSDLGVRKHEPLPEDESFSEFVDRILTDVETKKRGARSELVIAQAG